MYELIRKLGANMVKAAMILTGGLSIASEPLGKTMRDEIMEAAKPYGIRIMGPDCMGMLVSGHQASDGV